MNAGNQTQETELHRLARQAAAEMNGAPETPHEETPEVAELAQADEKLLDTILEDESERLMMSWTRGTTIAHTNLDQSGPAGRVMVSRALATADLRTRSVVGQTIKVIGYVAHVAQLTDKITGEISNKMRVVLFLDDGRTLSTMSAGCVRLVQYLGVTLGRQKWDPPILIETREFPLPEGKSYCDMREVMPTSETPPAKKGK
jgi:hypothetical protein